MTWNDCCFIKRKYRVMTEVGNVDLYYVRSYLALRSCPLVNAAAAHTTNVTTHNLPLFIVFTAPFKTKLQDQEWKNDVSYGSRYQIGAVARDVARARVMT